MTSTILQTVEDHFLAPGSMTLNDLSAVMNSILGKSVDAADLFFQSHRYESWSLEDGIVRDGSYNANSGVGIRAMTGEKTGFSYSEDLLLPALQQSAIAARSIAKAGQSGILQPTTNRQISPLYTDIDPLSSIPDKAKISLLEQIDIYARKLDPRIIQVTASLTGSYEQMMIMASDGTLMADVRPLVRCSISVIAEQGKRREKGSSGAGGREDYQRFINITDGNYAASEESLILAKEAVDQALINLEAIDAPAGSMTVVLGPGWPGVLLHEAIGHGLEGDFNRKGSSAFSGRIGERVASDICSIVDNGTLAKRRGSLTIDDEGTPTNCTMLIENGILKGYMQDKRNAHLMGEQSTGNGRRESYAHLPMPRMTNTYMLPGDSEHEEIIKSVKRGIYASNFGGGQVDITSGKFVFSASQAYLIEDGKITTPIKGATLIGNGPDVLTKVSMVGNNLELDRGIGVCGKEGQSVPVGVGQPTLKVDELTVGGTST
ncbi:MAG: metalloprotease TldD [Gammaproteobacteria bacterium]|nr:MAG: metalloprotease TldD [Gammaproteobacteria bacterium]